MAQKATFLSGKNFFSLLIALLSFTFVFAQKDVTRPTVSSVSPGSWSISINAGTNVSAVFSEAMNASSINGSTFQLRNALNNALVTATITYNAATKTATLYPTTPLNSLLYLVEISGGTTGVKDVAGNAMQNDYSWYFIMIPLVDLTDPTVLSVSPANGATGVTTGTNVTAVLSEEMLPSSINTSTVELRNASNVLVPAAITYNVSNRTITLDPSATLSSSTLYKATIKGGSSGVKDEAGNILPSTYTWSFTTAGSSDNTSPTILSVSPSNGATNISTGTTVSAIFSEAMNVSTISTSTFELRNPSNALVTAAVSYNATTRVATLTPSAALATSTVYTATVKGGTSGAKDAAGNAIVNNYAWSFTTAAPPDHTPPTILSVSPSNGTTGVSTATAVSAIFSEAMNAATISTTTFELRNPSNTLVTATVSYNATTKTATLTPSAALAYSTLYTATVKGGASGAKDAAGNAMVNNYAWSFTTAAPPDNTPPTIISVSPSNGTTGVSTGTAVSAIFSEALNAATISTTTFELRNPSNTLVTATVSYNTTTKTATLTPSAALAYSTLYTATVKGGASGVKDAAGNAMVNNYTWSFTTAAPPDNTPPTIVSVSPSNGTTGVSTATAVSAIFSEAMNAATISTTTFELRNPSNTLVTATVSYNATTKTATLTPSAALATSTLYTATVKGGASGVKDAAGNAMVNNYTWSFTTAAPPDNIPPTVTSVSPSNGTTGVSTATAVSAIFSEAMNAATISTTTFELRNPSNALVTATVGYNTTTKTATLTASAALAYSTLYTATVKGGASGAKDAAGNAMVNNYAWSFTTAAAPDNTPPTIISVSPSNGMTGVSTGTTVSAIFSEAMNAATISTTTFELRNPSNSLVTATVSYNATTKTVTLTPSAALATSTLYTATVKGGASGVKDAIGNAMVNSYACSFTTAAPPDNIPPTIISVSPSNGTMNVSMGTTVSAIFSEAMNAATISTTTFELRNPSNSLVTATVSYNATTKTVTLTPSAALATSTLYTATVKGGASGVKDAIGNAMVNNYACSFTTAAPPDNIPPTIISVSPSNGTMNVSMGTTVSAIFSEAMNVSAISTSTFELRDPSNTLVTATVTYNATTKTATLTPSAALAGSTLYTATVKGGASGVKDAAGNAMVNNYACSFTTTAPPDNTSPAVISVSPSDDAVGISSGTAVSAIFSEVMNVSTINTSTFELRDASSTLVTATVSYNATTKTTTLTPSAVLEVSTTYTATVKGGASGVKDAAGNGMVNDYTWTFTTGSSIFGPDDLPQFPAFIDEPVEVGFRFRSNVDGQITGLRFYKGLGNVGTHTGHLWTNTGTLLGTVVFTDETESGWQQVLFASPINITAGVTYVASYFSSAGIYAYTNLYFTEPKVNGPLTALANGQDGANGVYQYSPLPTFPISSYLSSNYFVDVLFGAIVGPDATPPAVLSVSPANGANGVNVNSKVSAVFSEVLNSSTVNSSTFELRNASGTLVPATITYNASTMAASLTPSVPLTYYGQYSAKIKGGSAGVKDAAGNAMLDDYTWSFRAGDPPVLSATDGPGGPILVISTSTNPFSRFAVEILRAEGLNEFAASDISAVTAGMLINYDVIVLGEMSLTPDQVVMLTNWVNAGGTLIAFKPGTSLAPLMGISPATNFISDKYLLVNTTSGPGAGIVSQTIQFHGSANLHTLNGATSLATLYSSATTATTYPAVTTRSVGTNGGRAIAFTYDLARSIVYTRQGNPAWAGQKRDGQIDPIRSDDLFFPDWIDFSKIAIPQADEQQRLLANIILQGNLHRKPLPRFWYLPRDLKAAVVMTGDDHSNNGTEARFNQYKTMGPNTAQDIADWKAVRGTSYMYPTTPISNATAAAFEAQGFEIALHPTTNCGNFTAASLQNDFATQLAQFSSTYPSLSSSVTNRTHCLVWSDWATEPKVELQNGIRMDVTYYYWPEAWMQNRPGLFTGSGMPMRFADLDGTLIDVYQAPTQMTDETEMDYETFCNTVLDRAIGAEGYYGVFTANMHNDANPSEGSDLIIKSAQDRQIPVISAKQMLTWLDGRNNSSFGDMIWNNNQLTFTVTTRTAANNLKAMLPRYSETAQLTSITQNGNAVPFTVQTIKGMQYAFFAPAIGVNTYVATYGASFTRTVDSVTTKKGESIVAATAEQKTTTEDQKTAIKAKASVEHPQAESLRVNVMPNPSVSYFNLTINSNDANPVTVRISDMFGRLIEIHEKITSTGILRLGQEWRGGTYFAEIIQGDQRKVVKLIKAN